MYFGPRCPFSPTAKSICILVTSGGRIAAPGPNLMPSNCAEAGKSISNLQIMNAVYGEIFTFYIANSVSICDHCERNVRLLTELSLAMRFSKLTILNM